MGLIDYCDDEFCACLGVCAQGKTPRPFIVRNPQPWEPQPIDPNQTIQIWPPIIPVDARPLDLFVLLNMPGAE